MKNDVQRRENGTSIKNHVEKTLLIDVLYKDDYFLLLNINFLSRSFIMSRTLFIFACTRGMSRDLFDIRYRNLPSEFST